LSRGVLLAGVFVLASCAGGERSVSMYTGAYRAGFETQAFWPSGDGPAGPYWVEGGKPVMDALDAAVRKYNGGSPWGGVRLRVKARLSAPGKYGHYGAYGYVLRIERVDKAGPPDDGAGARG
jgi:hypothetical protein